MKYIFGGISGVSIGIGILLLSLDIFWSIFAPAFITGGIIAFLASVDGIVNHND